MKITTIKTSSLKPGMVLADDLKHPHTGIPLLSAGTQLSYKHLEALKLFNVDEKCMIYLQEEPETAESTEIANEEIETASPLTNNSSHISLEKKIEIHLPAEVSQQVKGVYRDTYKAVVNFFYQSKYLERRAELSEVRDAAEDIASIVVKDTQVLLQIAVLKLIDDYTFSHAVHTAIYAAALANVLRFSKEEVREICLAGLLHDIGKVDIPDEILNKPAQLSEEEYKLIKEHVRYGFRRVSRFNNVSREVLLAIAQHHERIDGSGYLRGVKGEEIHSWAKILSVADVYDAVTTDRVYRRDKGAEVLMGSTGQLDRNLVELFVRKISIYPPGCGVRLSTGEEGKVKTFHPDFPLRPVVQVKRLEGSQGREINLLEDLTVFITDVIS